MVVAAHGCPDPDDQLFSGITDLRSTKNRPMLAVLDVDASSPRPVWLALRTHADSVRVVLNEGGGFNRTLVKLDKSLAMFSGEGTEQAPKVVDAVLSGSIVEVSIG